MKSESCLQLLGPNLTLFRTVSTLCSLVCILSDPLKNAFHLYTDVRSLSLIFSHFILLDPFPFFFFNKWLKGCVLMGLPGRFLKKGLLWVNCVPTHQTEYYTHKIIVGMKETPRGHQFNSLPSAGAPSFPTAPHLNAP